MGGRKEGDEEKEEKRRRRIREKEEENKEKGKWEEEKEEGWRSRRQRRRNLIWEPDNRVQHPPTITSSTLKSNSAPISRTHAHRQTQADTRRHRDTHTQTHMVAVVSHCLSKTVPAAVREQIIMETRLQADRRKDRLTWSGRHRQTDEEKDRQS